METSKLIFLVLIGLMMWASTGCCGFLLSAYEADQNLCLEKFDSPEEIELGVDIACVKAVRAAYALPLERTGCGD